MKQFLVLAGLLLGSLQTGAQIRFNVYNLSDVMKSKAIDKVLFTVQYQTTSVSDSLKPEKKADEAMMLKVGPKSSVYYSYAYFHTDSLLEADKASGASQEVINEHLKQAGGGASLRVYKNYPEGKTTVLDAVGMSRFRCEEQTERPQWTLLPDTMTFLSYTCNKAVCHFRGRDYEAWYTPEIPRSEGPWKLQGLPGLILKATDSRGHFTFVCSGIEKAREGETIRFGGSDYEPVSRKDLRKIYERFAADPIGYIKETSPSVQITVKGEDGRPFTPKNMPFNPMELE